MFSRAVFGPPAPRLTGRFEDRGFRVVFSSTCQNAERSGGGEGARISRNSHEVLKVRGRERVDAIYRSSKPCTKGWGSTRFRD